jgi:hypothetical protein
MDSSSSSHQKSERSRAAVVRADILHGRQQSTR